MPQHAQLPPTHILHRSLHEAPRLAVGSSGIEIHLSTSQKIIDASGGASVAVLGHTQPTVIAALAKQMSNITYIYSGMGFTSEPAEELATLVLGDQPDDGLKKAVFVCSGSEAIEMSLKLARQYHVERGDMARTKFVSRWDSYHGNTLGALAVSGHPDRRRLYEDMLSKNVSFVDGCYAYRGKKEGELDADYVVRLKAGLEEEFLRVGPEKVAAFIAETISGASLGCAPAVPGYFKAVREVCDRYGVLLILDEVMSGCGKAGSKLHAWEHEGIACPDIQAVAKALGGGYAPIAGVLLSKKVVDVLEAGTGVLQGGHTYQAHPGSCAVAVEVQKIIKRENLLENVTKQGKLLESLLKDKLLPMSIVGDVRGKGLFWGVEFVKDKVAKVPFERTLKVSAQIAAKAMELGLAVLPMSGTGGKYPMDVIIVSPPYVVTEGEVKRIVDLLEVAVKYVSEGLAA